MNKRRPKLSRIQRSVHYHSATPGESPPNHFLHMFLEDVSLGIMPIGGRSCRPNFKVTISPPDKRTEETISSALKDRDFPHSLEESVSDFFRSVAASLCASDRATYEIILLQEGDVKKIQFFELVFIPQAQLLDRNGQIFQLIPREIAVERNLSETIGLPNEDLIIFDTPLVFRGILQDVRTNLSRLSGFAFSNLALEAGKGNLPYNFTAHEESMKLALLETLRPIGWNARGTFNDVVLSYYWIRMLLSFESFKIQLRQAILNSLNEGLQRAGEKVGFKAQVEIIGLPTLKDVDKALQKLASGSEPFTKIMQFFKIHRS